MIRGNNVNKSTACHEASMSANISEVGSVNLTRFTAALSVPRLPFYPDLQGAAFAATAS